jgi:glycosyltransferase involved in cell wall biosynthesis
MSTTERPTLSVVIPLYNGEASIGATLDSVAAQTWEGSMEVVVIDDGSTDQGPEIARDHAVEPRVISQENTGVVGARRRGIEESRGEYIGFLDADDEWRPTKIAQQMAALEREGGPALSFTRFERVARDGGEVPGRPYPSPDLEPTPRLLIFRNYIGNSTVVVHRECLEWAGIYPTEDQLNRGGQDYAMWIRIASKYPLVYVPEILMEYGVHADNRVGTDPVRHLTGGLDALQNFHDWDPDRFRDAAGVPFPLVYASRLAQFTWGCIAFPDWPTDAFPRGAKAVWERLSRLPAD